MPSLNNVGLAAATILATASAVSAGWDWNKLPYQSEAGAGQTGYNNCTGQNSQTSQCQTAVVNSIEDFCLWGPPNPEGEIGATEQIEVAYCTRNGRGTRSIPNGILKAAHFIQTPDFIQITGYGDFTKMNVKGGDAGGELDPVRRSFLHVQLSKAPADATLTAYFLIKQHGPDGYGNPHGGLVFSDAFGGGMQQIPEWTKSVLLQQELDSFMSATQFCIRACNPAGKNAKIYCQHVYDVMGCDFNMPGDYSDGFGTCQADSGQPMGVYPANGNAWGSTFWQGQAYTPQAQAPGASSKCSSITDLKYGQLAPSVTGVTITPTSSSATVTSAPSSSGKSSAAGSSTTAKPVSSVSSGINNNAASFSSAAPTTSKPNGAVSVKSSIVGLLGALVVAAFCA
ncbi:hypothetical protein EMMF5_005324 [Cystobasidiomycetes sp. EMM_F5]